MFTKENAKEMSRRGVEARREGRRASWPPQLKAMHWVVTHSAKEKHTPEQRAYRKWMQKSRLNFMKKYHDLLATYQERAEKADKAKREGEERAREEHERM